MKYLCSATSLRLLLFAKYPYCLIVVMSNLIANLNCVWHIFERRSLYRCEQVQITVYLLQISVHTSCEYTLNLLTCIYTLFLYIRTHIHTYTDVFAKLLIEIKYLSVVKYHCVQQFYTI